MNLFNSLTKKHEPFSTLEEKRVVMYVCGLTPYDSAHIGHARAYVSFDLIKRYLIKKGFSVYHIQNITDVDDKIIKRCRETGADPGVLTTTIHEEALALFGRLNILPADVYPKVTDHISDIIGMVGDLIRKGHAYETETGVYFDISSFPQYGSLSGQNLEQIRAGSRFGVDETKKDAADFALWKKTKGEILEFESPWGRGRPGWHIECSAMSRKYAKRTLDIHGGARDLIFPHHENEIAQSEASCGERFCNYWVHAGFLTVEGEKMSKSLGNFITLAQALARSSPNALRLFYLQSHYRSPLDYDPEALESMEEGVERIFNSLGLIREAESGKSGTGGIADEDFRKRSDEMISAFHEHLENDFNSPEAIASLYSLLRLANAHLGAGKHDHAQLAKIRSAIEEMLWILGLVEEKAGLEDKSAAISALLAELGAPAAESTEEALMRLISMRDQARAAKDYQRSDLIRSRLKEIGIIIEDKAGAGGTRWKLA
ncbi:MAG: cysteine--tRNA ligase [Candidatus Micrarchaeota archaeon]